MQQVEFPAFTVESSRFGTINVTVSYAEDTLTGDGPTMFACAVGNAKNFISTAAYVKPTYVPCGCIERCKGIVSGFVASEKWNGEAGAYGIDLGDLAYNFGVAVAAQLS
jgi:hypothetical protein